MHKKQFPRVTGNGNPRTLHGEYTTQAIFVVLLVNVRLHCWTAKNVLSAPNIYKYEKKKVSEKKVFVIKMYTFLMNKYIATYKTGNNLFCSLLFEFLICRYSVKNTAPTIALMKCLLWWIFYPISFSVLSSQG